MAEQLYIKYHSFNPLADPTYKLTKADWFIMWRSELTHTEIQFPKETHGGISFSATNADSCKCARFGNIDFDKHPLRWETILIPVTRKQVGLIFAEACKMAGIDLSKGDFWALRPQHVVRLTKELGRYYGPNALKYDLLGLLSFTTKWEWIHPHDKYVWCTEACFKALMAAFPMIIWEAASKGAFYGAYADKLHPENGHKVIKAIYGKAA